MSMLFQTHFIYITGVQSKMSFVYGLMFYIHVFLIM